MDHSFITRMVCAKNLGGLRVACQWLLLGITGRAAVLPGSLSAPQRAGHARAPRRRTVLRVAGPAID